MRGFLRASGSQYIDRDTIDAIVTIDTIDAIDTIDTIVNIGVFFFTGWQPVIRDSAAI